MWTFEVRTGRMFHDGVLIATGYSGRGADLDKPAAEDVRNTGPLPEGLYSIGVAFDGPRTGPVSMRLIPSPSNVMHGRGGFLIHGDNAHLNHSASDGCIIMPHFARCLISQSADRELTVVASIATPVIKESLDA